jgi:hypothetical protein
MRENGLWRKAKREQVARSLESGVVQPEREIVHDTTHFPAWSSFETVKYEDNKGAPCRKSQSRLTKRCTCTDKDGCRHPWELTDDGAGTVVKSSRRMYWAHKASVVVLPRQGVPLEAAAVADAASHDSQTLVPTLAQLFADHPELEDLLDYVLDDSAADDPVLTAQVRELFGLTLRTGLNPRRRKALGSERLPRGMDSLTPHGQLVCAGGNTMDYLGTRSDTERFVYGPPRDEQGNVLCVDCPLRGQCCPNARLGRHVTVPFDLLPHIDLQDPPMAKRFKAMMSLRPSVERVIKQIKHDVGNPELSRRGNAAFQARLDKTLAALHILLQH